ncbi:hypothetical protein [Lacticaseibacillus thailandensis]|uniref:hypothetical protein n=1 Tax=Lacticaseibacillus thailandensis TaxID=381741 RepID=UPI0012E2DFC2|nr:hypothetical protein [Lacticaseibacillus thailandensis]
MREYRDNWGTTHTYTYTDPNTGKTETATEPVQNGTVLLDNHTGAILGFVGGVKKKASTTSTRRVRPVQPSSPWLCTDPPSKIS